MTATHVDGAAVMMEEDTDLMLAGRMVRAKVVRTLLLEDGRTMYGCARCDFVHVSAGGVPPHVKKHNARSKRRPARASRPAAKTARATVQAPSEKPRDDRVSELEDRLTRMESALTGAPGAAGEPASRLSMFHTGIQGMWICLVWTADRPDWVMPVGFFRTVSDAREWGRKNFPRRYKVGNMYSPESTQLKNAKRNAR